MTQRLLFVADHAAGLYRTSELARRYGISRKTAYKWLERLKREGPKGLEDRASVAGSVWNRTPELLEAAIVAFRLRHTDWGPKKLLDVLRQKSPRLAWPAVSTVAAILKRHNLVEGRRRRRPEGHPGPPEGEPDAPNQVWAMDFKGQFRMGNGRYCYPFTVSDLSSRYLLCCDAYFSSAAQGPRASLERLFREHGLPAAIRSDNGAPFASTGIARLSTLSVWLVSLGIARQLIQPGRPSQNGKHERMHRTLKRATTRPPARSLPAQQALFDAFRTEFNQERPHESLGMKRPSDLFRSSPRPYPDLILPPSYPRHFEVRRVSRNGGVRWAGDWLNVGHALIEQNLGFDEIADGVWDVYFRSLSIGRFDEQNLRLVGTLATHPRCGKRGNRDLSPSPGDPQLRDSLPFHTAAATL